MNKTTIIIENTLAFLFILLLLPFPKIIEEILIGSLFAVCFIHCFFGSRKFLKSINNVFSYNIPYITILTLLVQIHSVRFSLVVSNIQEQLFCVQLYKWLTDRLPNTESFLIGFLIYFWLVLYFLVLFLEDGVKKKSSDLNENNAFAIKKIRNYFVGSFVVCVCHFGSGMVKDLMFEKWNFETAFFNNTVISVGSTIPFVCIYLMMTRFLWRNLKCN